MKISIGLFLLLLISSCSDFSHVHYGHVKMVPATGVVLSHNSRYKSTFHVEQLALVSDSPKVTIRTSEESMQHFNALRKKADVKQTAHQIKKAFNENSSRKKNAQISQKARPFHKPDGSLLLILFFLFIGLNLMIFGSILFAIGIVGILWWLLALGVIVFLLGLLPFIGLLNYAFNSGTSHDPNGGYKEKQLFLQK